MSQRLRLMLLATPQAWLDQSRQGRVPCRRLDDEWQCQLGRVEDAGRRWSVPTMKTSVSLLIATRRLTEGRRSACDRAAALAPMTLIGGEGPQGETSWYHITR